MPASAGSARSAVPSIGIRRKLAALSTRQNERKPSEGSETEETKDVLAVDVRGPGN